MIPFIRKAGVADQSVVIRIIDSTDGTPEEAVEHDTSGIALWYRRSGATKTAITPAALAALDSAHSDGGIEHIDDGYYRLDLPDAAVAAGVTEVVVGGTVTGMAIIGAIVQLVGCDITDGVRLGLTALPNAAADAAGGLPVSDAGGLDLDAKLANTNEVTAARMGALTDWINGGRLDLIIDAIKAETDKIGDATIGLSNLKALIDVIDGIVDTILVDTNELQADWTDAGRLDALIDAIKAVTDKFAFTGAGPYEVKADVVDWKGSAAPAMTGDAFERLGAPAGASTAADVAAIKAQTAAIETDTQDLQTQIGAAGAGLSDIPKTGFKLASDGLDSVATTAPAGVASNFREMLVQVWRRFFKKATQTATELKTFADDGSTVLTTQALSDDGTTQEQGAAT